MKLSKILLVFGILLGGVTAFFLYNFLNETQDPVSAAVPQTDVVIARDTIPAHTPINVDMLEVKSVPVDMVHPEAGGDISLFVGGIARSEIIRGEQVLTSRVHTDDMRATLSYRIPENMRAISIPVGEVSGVSGYVTPGDKVDVLVTLEDEEINEGTLTTYTLFQNVMVLAIGELPREVEDDESRVVGTVTLMVTPEQAEVYVYTNRQGSFHLTLRSPSDENIVTLDSYGTTNFDEFRRR